MTKCLHGLAGTSLIGLLAGLLLAGCAQNHGGRPAEFTFMPGPITYGGVEYYPARPGTHYCNRVIDYCTNPPPAGSYTFVHLVSSNGIAIRLKDSKNATNLVVIPDLMGPGK